MNQHKSLTTEEFNHILVTILLIELLLVSWILCYKWGKNSVEPETIVLYQEESSEETPEPTIDTQSRTYQCDNIMTPSEQAAMNEREAKMLEARELLACVIYQEAGGDAYTDECRRMVADVVLNRVNDERFPNTIREVLTAPKQYGRFYYTGIVWPERAHTEEENYAVNRAYRIAYEVLNGQHSDLYGKGYIWQAEFKQGTDIIETCNTYFGR